ncbi:MAG TPA: hypothetical protein VHT49_09310 [Acidimicrobiales bacterium]|jgi:hypothetical protein|nr:hypothetical protein [Acidimicrobiales bacterium]
MTTSGSHPEMMEILTERSDHAAEMERRAASLLITIAEISAGVIDEFAAAAWVGCPGRGSCPFTAATDLADKYTVRQQGIRAGHPPVRGH